MEYRLKFENPGVVGGVASDDSMLPDVVRPVQTHSCNVAVIKADGEIPDFSYTDALVCFKPGIRIGVRTADCVPLVVYAPDIRAVAAVHAGWKGSIGGIVGKTVGMLREYGADLARAEAAFGPSICGGCYEISRELSQQFAEAGYGDCLVSDRHIDLESVNLKQLVDAGIPAQRIRRKKFCTFETPALPSWRREPAPCRLLTWISLK